VPRKNLRGASTGLRGAGVSSWRRRCRAEGIVVVCGLGVLEGVEFFFSLLEGRLLLADDSDE
jgi:hypothetical protein